MTLRRDREVAHDHWIRLNRDLLDRAYRVR
jgi:hypothetical protein